MRAAPQNRIRSGGRLVDGTGALRSSCAASLAKARVCFDNIRINGPRHDVEKRGRIVTQNVRQYGTTLAENGCLAKRNGFIGVVFQPRNCHVFLTRRRIGKLREASSLEKLAAAGMEYVISPVVYAAGLRGGSPFTCYFFLKAAQRRCSKLIRGLLQLNVGGAGLPARAVRQGRCWVSALLENMPVTPRSHRPRPATSEIDAPMYEWRALLFKNDGEMWVAGGAGQREPHFISHGVVRTLSLALSSFAEAIPKNLPICIGNAVEMNVMRKDDAHSDASARESPLINEVLPKQSVQSSWVCIVPIENPLDWFSRRNRLKKVGVARGWRMRRGARRAR
ncbi:hypothetical protein ERJ75_000509100 [Trypanosoma vivax]|uniref:Uncharacterized protein n=1 Tax=Trypanosoma vivax (strain Y486) TaxID=1055687 RepID=F9WP70_TRYVY|nr:hypothetical protein TRVL_05201 [Trypanosoma vivax]KAH8609672.1 hypothetical protein ERJ75_001182500 [Trypanosoma vivax]KAH8616124.1 hypothetical protein ERJ75_000509100 [Trypanosoma vivax]CCD19345.1 hypothetical protein, conserved in T.vivax [Trypanosoma vivax Y486]|eukprot:CCD19345.1 hypothetical protein, conserved in T.vivax [Trypanosoma vivax Y486]